MSVVLGNRRVGPRFRMEMTSFSVGHWSRPSSPGDIGEGRSRETRLSESVGNERRKTCPGHTKEDRQL